MARIRTIKPEFPQSESIGKLSRDARLLFIQLWTIADDEGRARAAPRMLASLLFPYDDDAAGLIAAWMEELEKVGCIRRYVVKNAAYLDIPGWTDHQKIDHASKSRLPAFCEKPREDFPTPTDVSRAFDEHSRTVVIGPRKGGDLGPKSSEANASDAGGPASAASDPIEIIVKPTYLDAKHELWGEGKRMMVELGVPPSRCGGLIGGWVRECLDDYAGVLDAIARAREFKPIEPIPWIVQALPKPERKPNGKSKSVQDAANDLTREVVATFGERPTAEVRLIGGGKVG